MSTINADLLPLAVDIATLNVLENNPRRGDIEAVRKSYEKFGQRKPIVARRGDRVVLAGNHQLLAARELGWESIAVVWVDDDDATSSAFVLADNRTADLGTYDDAMLSALLQSLDADSDLFAATGYNEDDLTDILIGLNADTRVAVTGRDSHGDTGARDYAPGNRVPTPESYAAAATRIMILSYPLGRFVWVQDQLGAISATNGLDSNAAAVEWLITQQSGVSSPEES